MGYADTGGVCDGNLMADEGLHNVDNLGPVGGDLHQVGEYLETGSLVPRALLAASLIADDGGFIQQTLFSDGITLGVVVNLLGSTVIPPSASVDVAQAGYTILGTTDTAATFCNSLGTPPVATVVVVGGQSISPVLDAGLIDVLDPNELVMSSATAILGNNDYIIGRTTSTNLVRARKV